MAQLLHPLFLTLLDSNGDPVSGGYIKPMLTGTTTAAPVYADAALTTPAPVGSSGYPQADSAGRLAAIYLDPSITYRIQILAAGGGSPVRDIDPANDTTLYALGLTVTNQASGGVSVKSQGAKVDGSTNDATAISATISANATATPPPIMIPGVAKVNTSVIIDRAVDSTSAELYIDGGSLYTSAAIKLVDTSFPTTTSPTSEWVTYRGVRFAQQNANGGATAVSGSMLRQNFSGCYFYRIPAVQSTILLQDWNFLYCQARQWQGAWCSTSGSETNIRAIRCTWENGATVFDLGTGVGGSIAFSLFENLTGPAFRAKGIGGFGFYSNYYEAISYPRDVVFTDVPGSGNGTGVHYSGNQHVTGRLNDTCVGSITANVLTVTTASTLVPLAVGQPIKGTGILVGTTVTALGTGTGGLGTYTVAAPGGGSQTVGSGTITLIGASVSVGKTIGASTGNSFAGIGYDVSATPIGHWVSIGDRSATRKFADDQFWEATANGITLMGVPGDGHTQTNYTAHAGGGQANATQLLHPTNYVGTVASSGDSVALPPTDAVVGEYGLIVWVVNDGASLLYAYYAQSDVTNFGGGGGRTTAFPIPAGQVRGFLAVGQGKWRMIQPPQAATVTAPSGGATIDTQARTAISSIITALQGAGLMA